LIKPIVIFALTLLLCACRSETDSSKNAPEPAAGQEAATDKPSQVAEVAFDQVMADITRDWLRLSPTSASALDVSEKIAGGRYIDRLDQTGLAARSATLALVDSIVERLEALQQGELSDLQAQMVEVQLFRYRQIQHITDLVDYGTPYLTIYGPVFEPYAVAQMNGPHIELTSLLKNYHPLTSVDEAGAFISRLIASQDMLEGLAEEVIADASKGAIPPDFVIDKTEALLRNLIASPPEEHPIIQDFRERVRLNAIDGHERLVDRALDALRTHTYPAYASLADTVASLRDKAAHDASLAQQPNGAALYTAMMQLNTDTELSADAIHQIGLDNVERIHAEMDAIMRDQGMTEGSVPDRLRAMSNDPDLVYPDTEEYKERTLVEVTAMIEEINAMAPRYFGVLPVAGVEVRRVPAFREATSAAGYYNSPAGDKPGIYYLNLRSTQLIPTWGLPTITYHEAVPGHHFQVALGLEREELPLIQRVNTNTNAFAEGWGLYAERLAWEMGMYKDKPLADIGRLYDELHRAVRLVVDTGIHAKGWSREEAIDYMASTKGAAAEGSGSEVVSEIERYVAMPGQALGYMVGMLTILELREEAQNSLGDDFDIRAFHDAVLTKGGMPLPLLQADVRAKLGLID
jgi:uncharacterized protein (DUF885 family)